MSAIEKAKENLKGNGGGNGKVPTTLTGMKSQDVMGVLDLYRAQIAQAVPKHLTPERIIQLSTTLIARSPELLDCSTASLVGGVMQASILGFEPVAALGQCYFVPFNNKKNGKKEVQFIIGYRGMIDLARRSNQIKDIYAQVVYENDSFDYEFGLEPKMTHKPALENRGNMTHVYAVAHFLNGGFAFEVMSKFDVDKIRKSSQAGSSQYSPWAGYYDEMAKKTVLRRLFKMLPTSVEFKHAEVTDEGIINNTAIINGEVNLNEVEKDYEVLSDTESVNTETGEIKIKEELFSA